MNQIEFEIKQAKEFVKKHGKHNFVFHDKKKLMPIVKYIGPSDFCKDCNSRSCMNQDDLCHHAMIPTIKTIESVPENIPWIEIRSLRGDKICEKDSRDILVN